MTIGIDIDDTLTNTKELIKSYWEEYYNNSPEEGYSKEVPSNINTYGFPFIEKFWDIYREQLFYPKFRENVSEVIKKLQDDRHTLCIITSRPAYKYKDLHKRLNNWFHENNIFIDVIYTGIKNKGHYCKKKNIDLLIDNDLFQIEEAEKYHVKTILFNNIDEYKGIQTTDWLTLYDIIKKGF